MAEEHRTMGYRAAMPEVFARDPELTRRPETTWDTVETFIQRRPFESLAGALFVGVCVGWLIKRR